ncbi:SufD family Fe-S cluster assembly protein [Streptococcus equi]|uniref:SufD family Fe-S cluster assembly protein n=1 Tax=Streptococcus equi TaxID=1336 RepID=UPI0039C65AF7
MEGCTAPTYSSNSLHAAIVEIFALDGAYMRYTTIQNWSDNVYNLGPSERVLSGRNG